MASTPSRFFLSSSRSFPEPPWPSTKMLPFWRAIAAPLTQQQLQDASPRTRAKLAASETLSRRVGYWSLEHPERPLLHNGR
ncbi:unnamed protein product [Sphagnum jensenii]